MAHYVLVLADAEIGWNVHCVEALLNTTGLLQSDIPGYTELHLDGVGALVDLQLHETQLADLHQHVNQSNLVDVQVFHQLPAI